MKSSDIILQQLVRGNHYSNNWVKCSQEKLFSPMVQYIFAVIPLKWRGLLKQLFSEGLFSPFKFIIHAPAGAQHVQRQKPFLLWRQSRLCYTEWGKLINHQHFRSWKWDSRVLSASLQIEDHKGRILSLWPTLLTCHLSPLCPGLWWIQVSSDGQSPRCRPGHSCCERGRESVQKGCWRDLGALCLGVSCPGNPDGGLGYTFPFPRHLLERGAHIVTRRGAPSRAREWALV